MRTMSTFLSNISQILLLAILLLAIGRGFSLKPISISPANGIPGGKECLQRVGELDKCLPKLVTYGDRNFTPPRSEEDLDNHCTMLDENVKCVSSYSRECLPSFARNLYSVVLRRLKTQFAKRCKTKDGRKEFLDLMICADPMHMEPANKCMDAFISHLEHIGSGNHNRQIELICCGFQLFQDCIFTASKKLECRERIFTADRAIDYVRSIINSMGGDMMDLMCGKYDKVSTCQTGHPIIMRQFKAITERVQNGTMKPISGSPLKPMLQLFISAQEDTSP